MSLEELEKRIRVLEDIEAIKRLKARYAQIIDGPFPAEIERLITENAILDYGKLGLLKGKRAITDFFNKKYHEVYPLRVHYFSQPDIKLEGEKAYGRWYMFVSLSTGDGKGLWSSGYQDDKYERENGEWLIAELKLTSYFRTTYEEGWHKRRFID